MKPASSHKVFLLIRIKSGFRLKSYLFLLLLQFLPLFASAQTAKIDSLKLVYKGISSNDTSKVNILNSIARELYLIKDASSRVYGEKALKLSNHLDYSQGKAKAYQNLGFHFKNEGNFEHTLQFFDTALIHYKKSDDQLEIALVYNYIGSVYYIKGDFQLASDNYEKALKINKLLKNEKEIATNIYNIGLCYQDLGNLPKALNYYLQALAKDELLNDKQGISYDYQALATVYSKLNDFEKANELYQKALQIEKSLKNQYGVGSVLVNLGINFKKQDQFRNAIACYNEAIQIFRNENSERGLLAAYVNLGTLFAAKGDDGEAKDYLNKAIELGQNLKSKKTLAETYHSLSQLYLKANNLDSALIVARKGLEIAEEINSREKITSLLLAISTVYKAEGNYQQALTYLEEHIISKDSLFNKTKSRQVKELQAKYETETKEQQITLLSQEKILQASQLENKSLMQKLLYGAIAMILLFSFVGFRYTKIKQESKRLVLNQQLKLEKEEAERLQELDKLKGRFFSNIAHEFRTPLTLILGPLGQVIEDIKNKGHKEQLGLVKSNASKLLRLINQLLDLSRLESGIIKLQPVQDDIVSFLRGITYSFHSLAEQKKIDLSFQSSENKLLMDFDKDKTEKILLNLLSNAFKFTPKAGSIDVGVEKVGDFRGRAENHLKVTVRDSGAGIPENELSKVFNRFYQADNSQVREVEGSGIGLALTKELVEVQNGTIEVLSGQEQGATFIFSLPITNESPIALNTTESDSNSHQEVNFEQDFALADNNSSHDPVAQLPADQHTSKEIVLVIEDNEDVRKFISGSLKQSYKIIEAGDGEEGFELAKQHIPDLIISDVMMPKMDGYETCKALKHNEITSHIPVILLTAKAGLESKLEGLETGADDYLPKPFNTKELKVRMKNLIRLRRNLREKYLQNARLEDKSSPIAPKENLFLTKIREIVEKHLEEEEFSIEDLSTELAMSRTQVHRKLKALTNQSASQFMRMIRLQHAQILLKEGINNVSEVAYKVGFSSPNYFSTCFTEFYGYAPSEQEKVG